MVHKYPYDVNEAETIEVSNEQIAAGLPVLLQVRRGSESALNQLLPDAAAGDGNTSNNSRCSSGYTKRWSAAAPISQEPKERYNGRKSDIILSSNNSTRERNWIHSEEDENERRDVFPPRRSTTGFQRDGSNRLSMQFYGDSPSSYKWAEAADRAINNRVFSLSLPREHRKKEPFSPTNSNFITPVEENVEYIVFKMDDETLGIHVVPEYDQYANERGLLVQRIESGGKVDRDGRLSVNDRIIEINDRSLLNKSFDELKHIFSDSLKSPELRLKVVKQNHSSSTPSSRPVNGVAKKQPPPPIYPKPSINHPKHPLYNKENIAMVESEEKNLSSSSKIATVSPTKKVTTSAPTGTNILMAVNTRKIGRKIELELTKGAHGLGFSITTRDNPIGGHCPIYIKNILPKGAAVEDGRLKCGDRLLSVNGVDLTGKTQADAVTELRNVPMGGKVKIIVSRQEDVAAKSEMGVNEVDAGGGSAPVSIVKRAISQLDGNRSQGAFVQNVSRKSLNLSNHQKQQRRDSASSLLNDSSASTEIYNRNDNDSTAPTSTDNSGNSEQSDNTVICVPISKVQSKPIPEIIPPRNPVLERLTGQLPNHNALRNESYYRATHQTSIMLIGKDNDRLTSPTVNQSAGDLVIIEEDPPYSPNSETSTDQPVVNGQHRGSTASTQATDVTYASQLSLDDGGGFARDAFGRQSMSEKRHATLDAKSTDTYQRNKKVRDDREKQRIKENRKSTIGIVKVNSTESIPQSDRNEMLAKNQLGPSLGMKKSSSLESLQTMVQEIQMAEDGIYRRTQIPVKVIRGRGCNESFRAAVDRSYDAPSHHVMESVPEDDGYNFTPRQSSLNSQLDCKLMKQQNGHKKKNSFLKGLGSMFRFGRHRKPAVLEERSPSSHLSIGSRNADDEEKERARKAAKDEQQRIQEQYKLLLQRQMDIQQQQQHQHQQQQPQHQQPNNATNQRMHNPTQYIQANNININNNYIPMTSGINSNDPLRSSRMQHFRAPQQYKYLDRRSLFPPETKEDFYNGAMRQSIRSSDMEPTLNNVNRSSGRYPQLTESNRYSHYVNYEEIQQHLNRKQQHYHSQRRDNREMTHRPVSNFYEYESVQSMIQNQNSIPVRSPFFDMNMNPSIRSEFFPSSVYGSTRLRNYEQRSYPIYQNSNIPYPVQFTPPQTQFFYHSPPLYSNIRPLPKTQGPYVTQVTIRDNHHHYTSNSLGTKV